MSRHPLVPRMELEVVDYSGPNVHSAEAEKPWLRDVHLFSEVARCSPEEVTWSSGFLLLRECPAEVYPLPIFPVALTHSYSLLLCCGWRE